MYTSWSYCSSDYCTSSHQHKSSLNVQNNSEVVTGVLLQVYIEIYLLYLRFIDIYKWSSDVIRVLFAINRLLQ